MLAQRHMFEIQYLYRNDPHTEIVEAQTAEFPEASAARHLMHVYQGDESFQAAAQDDAGLLENEWIALDKAGRLGITHISVRRLNQAEDDSQSSQSH
jgi:hypothetical protein